MTLQPGVHKVQIETAELIVEDSGDVMLMQTGQYLDGPKVGQKIIWYILIKKTVE